MVALEGDEPAAKEINSQRRAFLHVSNGSVSWRYRTRYKLKGLRHTLIVIAIARHLAMRIYAAAMDFK